VIKGIDGTEEKEIYNLKVKEYNKENTCAERETLTRVAKGRALGCERYL
jgi:hypothetical protein